MVDPISNSSPSPSSDGIDPTNQPGKKGNPPAFSMGKAKGKGKHMGLDLSKVKGTEEEKAKFMKKFMEFEGMGMCRKMKSDEDRRQKTKKEQERQ